MREIKPVIREMRENKSGIRDIREKTSQVRKIVGKNIRGKERTNRGHGDTKNKSGLSRMRRKPIRWSGR